MEESGEGEDRAAAEENEEKLKWPDLSTDPSKMRTWGGTVPPAVRPGEASARARRPGARDISSGGMADAPDERSRGRDTMQTQEQVMRAMDRKLKQAA